MQFSARAEAVDRRTYRRPLDESGTSFETSDAMVQRAFFDHHRRLWEEAGGVPNESELRELAELGKLRKVSLAGRTRWLGGTDLAFERAACQFNCSYQRATTIFNAVSSFWLELLGVGVGFKPIAGVLAGFTRPITEIEIVPSKLRFGQKGDPKNYETFKDGVWTIKIGDSAEGWAKSLGKLLLHKYPHVKKLVLDFSNVRQPGGRLKGFGWICNGWQPLAKEYSDICKILNSKTGCLLDEIDIHDIWNHLGRVLSTRRSAEISLMDYGHPRWKDFAALKNRFWEPDPLTGQDRTHRQQSNNSLIFWHKPSKHQLREVFDMMIEFGGSEPGIINAEAARRRAPWWDGFNPCAEILLPHQGFCNLTDTNIAGFGRDMGKLMRAIYLIARANYRQTCVNLDDGILEKEWHQTNESLRLCGVGATGICQADFLTDYDIKKLREAAILGAHSMADELGLPRSKLITTIKPSGTLSKVMDCTEGIHRPIGKYIFNWIAFSAMDPMVKALAAAGYRVLEHPDQANSVLICFPVEAKNVRFDRVEGKEVNLESAIAQLARYKRWMKLYCDHNASCTIYYDETEIDTIIDWMHSNWDDDFVAVSFLKRHNPTKTAKDLGFLYLPQEVVLEESYREYEKTLKDVDWNFQEQGIFELDGQQECAGGACPIK